MNHRLGGLKHIKASVSVKADEGAVRAKVRPVSVSIVLSAALTICWAAGRGQVNSCDLLCLKVDRGYVWV